MSRASELAREEAERAEAENPDEPTPDGEPEPEPQPEREPQAEASPVPTEADFKKADRLRETYRVKLAALLGDENVAHECALCSGIGYLPVAFPVGTMFTLTETEQGIQAVPSSTVFPPDMLPAEDKVTCDKCNGWGETITGSKAPGREVASCIGCSGNGWKQVPIAAANYVAATYQGEAYASPQTVPPNGGPADAFGRPAGHPHWGRDPATIGV